LVEEEEEEEERERDKDKALLSFFFEAEKSIVSSGKNSKPKKTIPAHRSSAECLANGSLASTASSVLCSSASHWARRARSWPTLSFLRREEQGGDDDKRAAVETASAPATAVVIG
jgi:hypothetical protein